MTAVVIAGRLAEGEQDCLTVGICLVGIGANGKAGYDGVSLAICIVGVKEAVCSILGMEIDNRRLLGSKIRKKRG